MMMLACAVYDTKVGAYMLPQFFRTRGEAIRAFIDACGSEAAPFRKHAEDYSFCLLGSYDDHAGLFVNHKSGGQLDIPEILMTALDAVSIDVKGFN